MTTSDGADDAAGTTRGSAGDVVVMGCGSASDAAVIKCCAGVRPAGARKMNASLGTVVAGVRGYLLKSGSAGDAVVMGCVSAGDAAVLGCGSAGDAAVIKRCAGVRPAGARKMNAALGTVVAGIRGYLLKCGSGGDVVVMGCGSGGV